MDNAIDKVSIIMPMYNRWDLTHSRLAEFRMHLPLNCEIILVDDASTDEDVRSGTAFWQKSGIALHPIKYIRNEENLGFTKSLNRGRSVATGNVIIFYSNDVIMSGNVINEVFVALDTSDKDCLIGNRSVHWAAGWNEFETPSGNRIIPYLEGYFIACNASVWDTLGWDERYSPYDYEDVDLSMQALVLGYNLVAIDSKFLRHLGGQTVTKMNPQREEITKRNRIKFIEKWLSKLLEL